MQQQQALHIFIIDDDQMLATALRSDLENNFLGYHLQISCFGSGEPDHAYRSVKPHLVLIDDCPGERKNGKKGSAELITLIRGENPGAEVILLTAGENADMAGKVLEYGAHDYIVRNDYMFRKLNLSVAQFLKLHELKNDMRRQQLRNRILVVSVGLIVGTLIALWLWVPIFPER